MTAKTKNWVLGVSGTVMGSVLCFLLFAWMGHFEATAETARTAEESAELIVKHHETQDRLIEIVDRLSAFHDDANAALKKVAELCRAGKLTDCSDCAESGVELRKCVQ